MPKRKLQWQEHDGILYTTLTDNSGASENSRKTIWIGIIKRDSFPNNETVTTSKIQRKADLHKMIELNSNESDLIADLFTSKELKKIGLVYLIPMRKPIKNKDGNKVRMSVYSNENGIKESGMCCAGSKDIPWSLRGGFVYKSHRPPVMNF